MPILTALAGAVTDVIPAAPGWRVDVYAPAEVEGVPVASAVVAWASIADPDTAGGIRLVPMFLAAGRAWTPDQFKAAYGQTLDVRVAPAQ
ncbi:hypothetical protein [Streptomyces sp. PD-S100-1]|uniref:hypothetical protein n=1 Tax=Streptomyces sp. PD-S100-1 TaxID=3394351 RepID=UPI0039BD4D0F